MLQDTPDFFYEDDDANSGYGKDISTMDGVMGSSLQNAKKNRSNNPGVEGAVRTPLSHSLRAAVQRDITSGRTARMPHDVLTRRHQPSEKRAHSGGRRAQLDVNPDVYTFEEKLTDVSAVDFGTSADIKMTDMDFGAARASGLRGTLGHRPCCVRPRALRAPRCASHSLRFRL